MLIFCSIALIFGGKTVVDQISSSQIYLAALASDLNLSEEDSKKDNLDTAEESGPLWVDNWTTAYNSKPMWQLSLGYFVCGPLG